MALLVILRTLSMTNICWQSFKYPREYQYFFSNSHSLLMINRVSLQSVNHSLEKINKKTHKLYFQCILNSYCKRLFLCSLYSENFFFYSDVQWFTSHHLIRFVTLIKRNKIERGIPQNVVQWKLDNFPLLNRSFLIK